VRELLSGPQSGYKPCPKSPQFCCGCFLREWAGHPWYILVELRVSPSILELPKRPLRCPSQLSPPFRTVLRQSAKFSPFIPVRLASHCALCIVHCALCIVHCALCIVHCALCMCACVRVCIVCIVCIVCMCALCAWCMVCVCVHGALCVCAL